MVAVTVFRKGPDPNNIRKSLAKLADAAVLVGIPQAQNARSDGELNNAELLYILTNGSPARGIPATPIIEPAIEADGNRQAIAKELALAAIAQISRNYRNAEIHFERAGKAGVVASKNWFLDSRNNWPPNKPSTIKRKRSGSRNIDTGSLRRALTYVLVNMPSGSGGSEASEPAKGFAEASTESLVEAPVAEAAEGVGEAAEGATDIIGEVL